MIKKQLISMTCGLVRLAALVALVDDGHTRLSIPREHPEIGLYFYPDHAGLKSGLEGLTSR